VISRAQAIESGMSADAVQRKLGSGRWERLHPGVYLAADHEYGDEARLRAAMLWAGEGATAHGLSAAWWHGIVAELPATVQITVPRARRAGRRAGLLVRRRDLATADHVPLRLLQVTDLPLTVLEAAICLGPAGSALLDRALQRTVRFPAVYRAHCRNLGRRGSPAASALLTAAADRAASQAERRLVRLLREHGITGWRLGYRYGSFLVDLAFPAERVAVEVDGWAWHVDAERFLADRQRQNALVTAGWTVLRFTWHDLEQRGTRVIAEIRAALHHLP
jgi:very-short-patch-repair endonuclease